MSICKKLFKETSHPSSYHRTYKPDIKFHQIFSIILSFLSASVQKACLIFARADILRGIFAWSLLQLGVSFDKTFNAVH